MARTKTSFKKGEAKGRPKGAENHLTKQMRTVKETVLNVFNQLQDDPETDLISFAQKYPRDFHQIAAKLIPAEITANVEVVTKTLPPFMKSNDDQS